MATQPTQGDFNDGSMWPDGCPECRDGRYCHPYMWKAGIAHYLCPVCRHQWRCSFMDLPDGLTGTNILNTLRLP